MQSHLRTRGAGGASLDSAGVGFSRPRASSSLPEVFTVLGCSRVVLLGIHIFSEAFWDLLQTQHHACADVPQANLDLPTYHVNGSTSSAGVATQWHK